ncbi:T9SS type A sorting domain-containing protein [Winogradskyella psychrotolerans]|uniref:T9SS type A sorting domain-containing protein n=1 Tax=Winogradskyella psychrotolerans TaxID=1344585 RepID=UPI001C07E18A|nr:T9SS type A sorting domain-containing protein [Winogradskyella psychrotolerans]MBU2927186.1 T9SS type A sorting domain-containing protein [Winogradskyella psychrotolerans]
MKIKLLLVLVLACTFSFAQQIPEDIKPPSWSKAYISDVIPFKLPTFDLKALQDEDLINDQDKSIPWRFGHDIYVDHNFNEVGEWTTLENGDRIWRMSYSSEGAYSLNFMFDVFKIPEGAKLYVYNEDKTDLLRPFTYHNNNAEEVLGTWLVEGDSAYIEYYQPANVVGEAKITVGSVVHGYRTAENYQKSLNDSGSCNQDVDCDITPTSDPYDINTRKEEVKKAVAMLVSGGGFCSGTLVNNTNNDETPYFLTANHCSGGEGSWAFRFNWRSPNPSCGTTTNSTNGTYDQTVSGAVVRAQSSQSDMELVEITDTSFFENNPDVIWAGWNNSTTQTPAMSFGIHHPSGDIQKVSRNDEGAFRYTTSFNGNATTQMWRINDWELGVTEGGSSGSGLFNETGHLIGMLSAGTAACSGTVDNGGYDIYGRFGVAWDYGTTASTRLKDWLDPSDSGVEILDQYPSLQTYDIDARVTAGSGNAAELCGEDFTPEITLVNSGVLTLTSADVSYSIDDESNTPISWTGNLLNGESVVVATPTYSNLGPGSHSLEIIVSNPNGTQDENTTNDTYSFNFEVSPSYTTTTITLDLLTDNYGYETTWDLVNSSGVIVDSGMYFDSNSPTSYEEIITIPSFNECYTFTIYDEEDDGICCFYGSGSYSLKDENDNEIISGGEFTTSESVTFNVQDPLSVNEFSLDGLINLYPNPVNNNLNIDLNNLNEDVSFKIFDTLGKQISHGDLRSNDTHTLNISNYQSGIYFIKLSTDTSTMTQKFIKK